MMKYRSTRLGLGVTLVLTALVAPSLVDSSSVASADPLGWKHKMEGDLHSAAVPCATLCTEGVLTDDLAASFVFTMTGMGATADSAVVTYSGLITYYTERGELTGVGTGVWNLATGAVVDTAVITGGTGDWEGAWGEIVVTGVFDPLTAIGNSTYEGEIYTPKPLEEDADEE
jgi:hypothetical protein